MNTQRRTLGRFLFLAALATGCTEQMPGDPGRNIQCTGGVCSRVGEGNGQVSPDDNGQGLGCVDELCGEPQSDDLCRIEPLADSCDCRSGETRRCGIDQGICQSGYEQCLGGVWSETCVGAIEPEVEQCQNDLDDDCDGNVDEDCGCNPGDVESCGQEEGVCRKGSRRCLPDGQWSACEGGVAASAETCNGLDDDCDGRKDWNERTDMGWQVDALEPNDTCGRASFGDALEAGGDIAVLAVNDAQDLRTYPSIYPLGDRDWYAFPVTATPPAGCGAANMCRYRLSVALNFPSGSLAPDARLCIQAGRCGAEDVCTAPNHWDGEHSRYQMGLLWNAPCGIDTDRTIYARVEGSANLCEYYRVMMKLEREANACAR